MVGRPFQRALQVLDRARIETVLSIGLRAGLGGGGEVVGLVRRAPEHFIPGVAGFRVPACARVRAGEHHPAFLVGEAVAIGLSCAMA